MTAAMGRRGRARGTEAHDGRKLDAYLAGGLACQGLFAFQTLIG